MINLIFKLITTAILLMSGANFIQRDRKHLRNLWFIFGFINIGVAIISDLKPGNILIESARYLLLFIFFLVITISLLQQIFSIKHVTIDVIIGAFCGYLLIGIISFFFFTIIDHFRPGSLSGLMNDIPQKNQQIFYFSFTCLTTLGFGDILPVNMWSQKLSVFTAAVGQFYIAVVVAILVSRFMNSSSDKKVIH